MKSWHYLHFEHSQRRSFLYVWIAAIISILFFVPAALPKLIPAHAHLPFSMNTLIIIQIVLYVIYATIFAAVGAYLSPRIGFRAYLADVPIKKRVFWIVLKRQFFYGAPIGFAGAIIAYLIAPDFITYLSNVPFIPRLFGSIFEEVIMRLGSYDNYSMDFIAHFSTTFRNSQKYIDWVRYFLKSNPICCWAYTCFNKFWYNQSRLVRIYNFYSFSSVGLVVLETRIRISIYSPCKFSCIRSSFCCNQALSY